MEYNSPAAIYSGLIAGAIMLIPIYLGRMMMPEQMKMDLLKMLGTMMMPVGGMTYGIGLMIHAVMSIVFASAHAAFYLWLDIDSSYGIGIVFGLVHFIGTGMFFGMLSSSLHRGIRDGAVEAPGFFALKLGGATAMGALVVHIIFGLVVGGLYESFS
ncbi:MAG: hypothetical protein HN667_07660 [Chloroflexi bacterium]|jgi:hypothetical protein|nr:hypothetical protein [Chloroflexota bacterium]MBT5253867.1 hypothetical protein [Chloroflexota bacterium]MBT5477365.1 hypothetical protein [Chloroflexota bacterium]MBT7468452.1 hypothetical protein [Chloroflexota bacterium]MBT7833496.1 hypothetical protein [Chloroflexota bacterium]